jgi:prepilin-type N-terminal cleavage/methylation domain-containing protein
MKLHRIIRNKSKQSGFTLIELLIGVAIMGILILGIAVSIAQVMNINAQSTNQMITIKEVENAIDNLRVDIQMAQTISYGANHGFPLILRGTDWDNNDTEVKYTLVAGELQRKQTTNNDDASAVTRAVGRNINSVAINTSNGSKTLNITLTSRVSGFKTALATRTFEILPRPGS